MKRLKHVALAGAFIPTVLVGQGLAVETEMALRMDSLEARAAVAEAAPLFADERPLIFTIEAPFTTIFKDRSQESEEFEAKLLLDGAQTTLDIQLRTRGKFRLKRSTCEFPPLRLNFKKKAVGGTVFESQDKIKLVTHCQTGRDDYQQYLLQEYVAYKAFSVLTDLSFRVRLAWVTYIDTEAKREPITRPAVLLEDDDMVATRNRFEVMDVPSVSPNDFEPHQLALVEIFQYMIGNVDWSAFRRERDREFCCHNVKVVGTPEGLVLFPLPYDFDFAGIVNARYANVPPALPIRTTRQRFYRGRCVSLEYLDYVAQRFNDRRDELYALYQTPGLLEPEQIEKSVDYLDEFYEVLNDDGKIRREFRRRCRDV